MLYFYRYRPAVFDNMQLVALVTALFSHTFEGVFLSLVFSWAVRAHPVGGGAERPVFRAEPVPEERSAVAAEEPRFGLHGALPNTACGQGIMRQLFIDRILLQLRTMYRLFCTVFQYSTV